MIKTRKHAILPAFSIIFFLFCAVNSSSITATEKSTTDEQKMDLTLPELESKSYKRRMRKQNKKTKKEKKIYTYQDMSYDELAAAKDLHIANGNITSAIKYLEQMMKLCNDITKLAEHLLQVADLFFQDNQFPKAARLYTEFSTLYPGSEQQEYALYRAIYSSFSCILSIDRDQTKTEETVALTEIFLRQDHFTTHRQEVAQIQVQCYEKLAASACSVCSFYLTRERFTAAEKRIKKIRSTWLPKLPALEPEIIALETTLAEKREAAELLQLKNKELAESKQQLTLNKKTKRMTDRF